MDWRVGFLRIVLETSSSRNKVTIFGEVFFFSKMCPRPFFCCPHSGKVSVAASPIERWVVIFRKVKKQFQAFLINLSVQFLSFLSRNKIFFCHIFLPLDPFPHHFVLGSILWKVYKLVWSKYTCNYKLQWNFNLWNTYLC